MEELLLTGGFGEALLVYVKTSCNIILVEIEASEGNWSPRLWTH
jgi:hypothetical protein